MANILDYLDWRGDLTFAQAPFNEVDNLILAELSFVDLRGIVPGLGEGGSILLREAAQLFFARFPRGEKIDMGVLVPDEIPELLRKMAQSARFGGLGLNCFEDRLDRERGEQFAALTVETGDGALYLAFRGTDDTLAGWKEDFMLACTPEIPAQRMAVEYVEQVARQYPRKKLRIGGHSKGGNLAVWSAVHAPAAVQRRIQSIWSNDGPGFHTDILSLPRHAGIVSRITTLLPQSSLVGMILEHDEDYTVVESTEKGAWQHDGFSWEVRGGQFVHLHAVTRQGRHNDLVLKEWVRNMPLEQREKFVEGLFDALAATGAETLTDLKEESLRSAAAVVRAMKDMEKDTRDTLLYAVKLLLRSNWKVWKEDLQQEAEQRLRETEQKLKEAEQRLKSRREMKE